ncbi:uncharacterized protein MONOS_1730 [Monocercomonoides exilis]|uniref:uncharacterized protein n=1 Tax=Monocercomonoides exilis TaxID=2049356 RepID=UPI00355AA38B|nr:hypothetical protein MONOS_1730 [Monocercomonoides exilis]|eukprot:MONOS_1730.1-p1 / transcript=MONOS_1730.1 / gene=MONOS_1730 / organism=Monocercomonoides_exilis_PA203 / gene_product=unspecified product / transcript_product=unspecified product / location=Mono_scaffold00032:71301-71689(+) / protein_length=95 / sequence_SO=supercontig / SO=protein_coding / is_pseudo=false
MFSVPLVVPLPSLAASDAAGVAITAVEACGGEVMEREDEVMGRGVAVCEVGEIVEKGMEAVWLRIKDVILLHVAIALAAREEREETEEGEREEA